MKTAKARFDELHANRNTMIDRYEDYARYTIPHLLRDSNFDQLIDEETVDYQSFGARCVNHLTNKLMLALFAPSRPFFRIDLNKKTRDSLLGNGFKEEELTKVLSENERSAIKVLDQRSVRTKIHDTVRQLIVTGNVLLILDKDKVRVINIKNYVVVRDASGNMIELIIRQKLDFSQLKRDIQNRLKELKMENLKKVEHYIHIKVDDNDDYIVTQHIDNVDLGDDFKGKYNEDDLPYRVLTWEIADGDHYGTGLVQLYVNSFAKISKLSRAETEAGIQASELRWMVNPEGLTSVQDFQNTSNGDVIPGRQGDIAAVSPDVANAMQVLRPILEKEKQEVSQAFLLNTAMVRDAERVTAEEIRMQANELETSLGGAYSRIAVDLQKPVARWLLKEINVKFDKKIIETTIVTGLDALSRNGDLDNMMSWVNDLAALTQLPPALLSRLKLESVAQEIAAARGVDTTKFWKSEAEMQQEQAMIDARQQQQAAAGVSGNALPQQPQ